MFPKLNRPLIFFSTVLYLIINNIPFLSTLNNTDSKILQPTDSYLTQTLVLRLMQKLTRSFLTQPLAIFYPLKVPRTFF